MPNSLSYYQRKFETLRIDRSHGNPYVRNFVCAPHVTGAAALYLQNNPFASPAQVQSYVVNRAAPGKVRNVPPGTTQSLLYVY